MKKAISIITGITLIIGCTHHLVKAPPRAIKKRIIYRDLTKPETTLNNTPDPQDSTALRPYTSMTLHEIKLVAKFEPIELPDASQNCSINDPANIPIRFAATTELNPEIETSEPIAKTSSDDV